MSLVSSTLTARATEAVAGVITASEPIEPAAAEPALTGAPATVALVVAAVLVLTGAVWVLLSAIAMHRVRDALSRVNALSPATGMGLTSIVLGAYLHGLTVHAFTWLDLVKLLLTLGALLLVSSVASNTLSRAAVLSGAEFDPETRPNDLTGAPPRSPRHEP